LTAALTFGDFKAAFSRFQRDQVTDHAAALTYYSMLSLFPALLLGVAVLGLVGQQQLIDDAATYMRDAGAPDDVVNAVTAALKSAQSQRGTAVGALVLGAVTSLYGASSAFGAVGRALNHIWRVEEGRGFVKQKAQNLAWTLLLLVLAVFTFILIFLGGGLAGDVLGLIGLGDNIASVWRILRWPAALLVAMLIYAIVYYAAPNVEIPRFRFITPGAVFGVLTWIVASAGFFIYASNFSSYGATYGSFATVVVLLIWIWLTNIVLLFGAELNAVVDIRRTPGLPPDYDGPVLAPREPADD
jgi:membrane protein